MINDESRWNYIINKFRFKAPMLKSSLCDCSNVHRSVKETIAVAERSQATPENIIIKQLCIIYYLNKCNKQHKNR